MDKREKRPPHIQTIWLIMIATTATPLYGQAFRFQFDEAPYEQVIRSFAQAVDRPIIGDINIPGHLTFTDSKPYDLDEALRTLNVLLELRGFMLIETDRFLKVVSTKQAARSVEIGMFRLRHASATRLATVLGDLFGLKPAAPRRTERRADNIGTAIRYVLQPRTDDAPVMDATLTPGDRETLSITVDQRTNSILITGPPRYIGLARQIIGEIDGIPAQERKTQVYRLRNAQAVEVQAAVRTFLDQQWDRLIKAMGTDALGAAQRLLEQEIAIVAEPTANALLISASPRYFDTVFDMIRELDQAPPQVLIQVLLIEVTLGDETDLGFQWRINKEVDGSNLEAVTDFALETAFAQTGGLAIAVTGGDISLFLRALESENRLEVLSRPQILAADNQLASINVGQRVPFISSSRITDEGSVFNTIEYQDVGVILKVTPRINPDGFVRLEVEPEISSLSGSNVQVSEGVNAVIVNSRSAKTTVTVQDGHTIIIGGLITTRDERRESKVPLLGDVPIVQNLFRSTTSIAERSELLIILTPYVINNVQQSDDITRRKMGESGLLGQMELDETERAIAEPLQRMQPSEPEKGASP